MTKFSGLQYLYIAIAGAYGLDKELWETRIQWTKDNMDNLEALMDDAEEPMLYIAAVIALRDTQKGITSGYVMGLDSTASGLQMMACLIGCKTTAMQVNLFNTGRREDVYSLVGNHMGFDRKEVKTPLMTHFYGSVAQPKEAFGPNSDALRLFYDTLHELLPGANELLDIIQKCWQPDKAEYIWTLPDKHTAVFKVSEMHSKKIEVDELDHATFTHRAKVYAPTIKGISLCANIIHSVDAYVCREMIRRANKQGFGLLTVHDDFRASPNHMNEIRQNYLDILMEIADSSLMEDILKQVLSNPDYVFNKYSNNLKVVIRNAEYALS